MQVRDSPEKRAELWRLGRQSVPGIDEYLVPIHAICPTHLHVQTANAFALAAVEQFAAGKGMHIAYTDNARPGHDSWGGWNASQTMEDGIVGFVNLAIGAQARSHEIAHGWDLQSTAPTHDHVVHVVRRTTYCTARRRASLSRPCSRCGRCWSRPSWSRTGRRCRSRGTAWARGYHARRWPRAHRVRRFSQAQLCCQRGGRSGWLSLTAHPSVSAAEIEDYATRMRRGVHSSTGLPDPHIHDARPYDSQYPPCLIRGPGLNPKSAERKPRLVEDTESFNRI